MHARERDLKEESQKVATVLLTGATTTLLLKEYFGTDPLLFSKHLTAITNALINQSIAHHTSIGGISAEEALNIAFNNIEKVIGINIKGAYHLALEAVRTGVRLIAQEGDIYFADNGTTDASQLADTVVEELNNAVKQKATEITHGVVEDTLAVVEAKTHTLSNNVIKAGSAIVGGTSYLLAKNVAGQKNGYVVEAACGMVSAATSFKVNNFLVDALNGNNSQSLAHTLAITGGTFVVSVATQVGLRNLYRIKLYYVNTPIIQTGEESNITAASTKVAAAVLGGVATTALLKGYFGTDPLLFGKNLAAIINALIDNSIAHHSSIGGIISAEEALEIIFDNFKKVTGINPAGLYNSALEAIRSSVRFIVNENVAEIVVKKANHSVTEAAQDITHGVVEDTLAIVAANNHTFFNRLIQAGSALISGTSYIVAKKIASQDNGLSIETACGMLSAATGFTINNILIGALNGKTPKSFVNTLGISSLVLSGSVITQVGMRNIHRLWPAARPTILDAQSSQQQQEQNYYPAM